MSLPQPPIILPRTNYTDVCCRNHPQFPLIRSTAPFRPSPGRGLSTRWKPLKARHALKCAKLTTILSAVDARKLSILPGGISTLRTCRTTSETGEESKTATRWFTVSAASARISLGKFPDDSPCGQRHAPGRVDLNLRPETFSPGRQPPASVHPSSRTQCFN